MTATATRDALSMTSPLTMSTMTCAKLLPWLRAVPLTCLGLLVQMRARVLAIAPSRPVTSLSTET
jgi:hypothetical protein